MLIEQLFGRKLPSDSLFSKKENRVLWWNLLSIENQLIKKSKNKKEGLFL
jgi:hypothetical protein